jgi:hypothetical protein
MNDSNDTIKPPQPLWSTSVGTRRPRCTSTRLKCCRPPPKRKKSRRRRVAYSSCEEAQDDRPSYASEEDDASGVWRTRDPSPNTANNLLEGRVNLLRYSLARIIYYCDVAILLCREKISNVFRRTVATAQNLQCCDDR